MASEKKSTVGWREWVQLPQFNISAIKAKIDTGAKTSCLHAYFIEPYEKDGEKWLRFGMHPLQNNSDYSVDCHARLLEQRKVTDSGGHTEERYVIETLVTMGQKTFSTEITLTNRENMRFRMLIGRSALNSRFKVDPARSFLFKKDTLDSLEMENDPNDEDNICNEE